MKYAILGDIHGNLEAFQTVLDFTKAQGVEKYACIGDVVGYNANPKECLQLLRSLELLGCVKGNHDDYVSNGKETIGFNPMAAKAVQWTREQLDGEELKWLAELPYVTKIPCRGYGGFQLVHGTLDSPKNWGYIFDRYSAETCIGYQSCSLCFLGHTHIPVMYDRCDSSVTGGAYDVVHLEPNHKYLFNVGSVGQPRDGIPKAAVVIFDSDELTVTLTRLDYDIPLTQKKIREAGLPDRLAERLDVGR